MSSGLSLNPSFSSHDEAQFPCPKWRCLCLPHSPFPHKGRLEDSVVGFKELAGPSETQERTGRWVERHSKSVTGT